MNTYQEKLEGREFDWFAVDSEGSIAMFATAGEGLIPPSIIETYEQHESISESLESPNWGSKEVWSDYAALGFYVYDWNLPGGPYKRIREPSRTMSIELKAQLMAISSIFKLSGRFSKLIELVNIQDHIQIGKNQN